MRFFFVYVRVFLGVLCAEAIDFHFPSAKCNTENTVKSESITRSGDYFSQSSRAPFRLRVLGPERPKLHGRKPAPPNPTEVIRGILAHGPRLALVESGACRCLSFSVPAFIAAPLLRCASECSLRSLFWRQVSALRRRKAKRKKALLLRQKRKRNRL